jgi:hypothetical protein
MLYIADLLRIYLILQVHYLTFIIVIIIVVISNFIP